jgi:2'-5' RNA ligase
MRLFVAAELPPAIRENLAAAQRALRTLSLDVRWARPEGMHLTLVFLGEVLAARLSGIAAALGVLQGAPAGPIALEARGLGIFPERGRPRVIWAGLAGDLAALGRLQDRVATAMRQAGLAIEARDWHPHLTLGRVLGGRDPEARERIGRDASTSFGAFEVQAIHLFESELLPGGARYRSLRAFPLAAAGEAS